MIVASAGVGFGKIPIMVTVRKKLSKARHQYLTFLAEQGYNYLRDSRTKESDNTESSQGKAQ